MNGLIPIVVEPLPDELLFSWIMRLAKVNELSLSLFVNSYFDKDIKPHTTIPVDIRRGYPNFYEALDCDIDMMKLYSNLSTMQFELSFYTQKYHIKILNNILCKENDINTLNRYFITKPRVCLECLREDFEKYGEKYFHRSHQLSGVVACHKHHTPLYEVTFSYAYNQQINYEKASIIAPETTDFDCKYAEYTHFLLNNSLSSNANIIFSVIANEIEKETGDKLSRQDFAKHIAIMLDNADKEKEFLSPDKHFEAQDIIKILMMLFPNPNDFLQVLPQFEMIVKEHCDDCNQDFYTTLQAIDDGWGCSHCRDKKSEKELLKTLVSQISENELEFHDFTKRKKQLVMYHKETGDIIKTRYMNFLFKDTKPRITFTLTRKDAEKRINNKDYELLEFSGAGNPVKIRHIPCGKVMEFDRFNHFERNQVCRHCELHHYFSLDYFKEQVKDLVGNEYNVVEDTEKVCHGQHVVIMRHNKCGKVSEYMTRDFLYGCRCPDCRLKVTTEDISNTLEEYSDDRYSILGIKTPYLIIFDKKTNEQFHLRRTMLLQEMLRPTPSPIIELKEQVKKIKTATMWDMYYKLCKEYKEEFGYLYLTRKEKYKNQPLGFWCDKQRSLYNKGQLTNDKVKKLTKIGFVFDGKFYLWCKRFEEYKEFINETGRIAPKHGEIYNGHKVGSWFFNQRQYKLQGILSNEQIRLLLEFNPKFFDKLR